MKHALKLTLSFAVLIATSCQTTPAKRSIASFEGSFGKKGSYENPVLNEEYELPLSKLNNRSPADSNGKPYIDFSGKYGLQDKDFETEEADFLDQVQRIHIVQLLNVGVEPEEIKYLASRNVDFTDLGRVQQELNDFRNSRRSKLTLRKKAPFDYRDLVRGFHAKAHGCVEAKFSVFDDVAFKDRLNRVREVNPNLDYTLRYGKGDDELYKTLRQGLFKDPISYKALVRFSNGVGDEQDDHSIDVRGLAFKLLLDEEDPVTHNKTQDFLMTNQPNPFGETSRQFINFAFSKAEGFTSKGNLPKFVTRPDINDVQDGPARHYLLDSFKALVSRHRGLLDAKILQALLKIKTTREVSSLATETYWSGSPYRLGDYAIKFQVKPSLRPDENGKSGQGRDYLRADLQQKLSKDDLVYTFYVQLQTDPVKTPIEDALVPWEEQDAPPLPIGELRIFRGQETILDKKASRQLAYCKGLSYNPWHFATGHKPIGNINRGRLSVYKASSQHRHGNLPSEEPSVAEVENVYGRFPQF
jgi:hypothetical protein